jgi:hypothetical protein
MGAGDCLENNTNSRDKELLFIPNHPSVLDPQKDQEFVS